MVDDHQTNCPPSNVISTEKLIDNLHRANDFRNRNDALMILEQLSAWVELYTNKTEDIFNSDMADFICAVAIYRPELAFRHLSRRLDNNFSLTSEIFENENYRQILQALANLAVSQPYFYYAANHMLSLAAQESELRIDHAQYKANPFFCSLFVNSGSGLESSLEHKRHFLENNITTALQTWPNSSFRLVVLMDALHRATSVFDAGEYSDAVCPSDNDEFERYIEFAIYQLLRFVGIDNDMARIAEDKLHEILTDTIDQPNILGTSEVPFIILRYQLEHKRNWKVDPFYSLRTLLHAISSLDSSEFEPEYIHDLKLRFQQLVSLFSDRAFLSNEFTLFLGSKKPEKFCEIHVDTDSESSLTLHQRQSLVERLIFSGTTSVHEINRGYPKTTYIIANFGVVITDRNHQKKRKPS